MSRTVVVSVLVLFFFSLVPLSGAADEATQDVDAREFLDYFTHDGMVAFLYQLQADHPNEILILNDDGDHADLFEPTWEGRETYTLKLSTDVQVGDTDKPDTIFVGMHHSREWMSFTVPLYFLHWVDIALTHDSLDNDGDGLFDEDHWDGIDNDGDGEDDDNDPETPARFDGVDNDGDGLVDEGIDEDLAEAWLRHMLATREIYIMPQMNPDGYEYDRLTFSGYDAPDDNPQGGWRKNLRDNLMNGDVDRNSCDGVDLNRNYPYHWGEAPGQAPLQPCGPQSDIYGGPVDTTDDDGDGAVNEDPVDGNDNDLDGLIDEDKHGGFSEPETRNYKRIVENKDDDGDGRPDFRTALSFHSYSEVILHPWGWTMDDPPDLETFLYLGRAMEAASGYELRQGNSNYPTSGNWYDWLYGSHNIYGFTIEIGNNFHEQRDMIEPLARRNMGVISAMLDLTGKLDGTDVPNLTGLIPKNPIGDEKVEITLEIANHSDVAHADLFYRTITTEDGLSRESTTTEEIVSNWKRIRADLVHATWDRETYQADLPAQEAMTTVEYYWEVETFLDEEFYYPEYGREQPASFEVSFAPVSWVQVGIGWGVALMLFAVIYGGLAIALRKMLRAERDKGF